MSQDPPVDLGQPRLETPGLSGSQGVVKLYLELVPKTGNGVLKDVAPGSARALQRALDAYVVTVRAAVPVDGQLDRVEAPVYAQDQNPRAAIPLVGEQAVHFTNEEMWIQDAVPPVGKTFSWRQQAAAIIIAIVALLTSILQLLK